MPISNNVHQPGLLAQAQSPEMPPQVSSGQENVAENNPARQSAFSKGDQQQYDMFMAYCMKVLHSKAVSDNVAQSLSGLTDINQQIDHIARLTLDIIVRVETAANDKGQQKGDNVNTNAANEVMADVIKISEIAGMKKLTDEQKAQAYSLCVSLYLDQAVKTGKMTPEDLQQAGDALSKTKEGQAIAKTRQELLSKKKSAPVSGKVAPMSVQPQQGMPQGGMTNG